MRLFAFGIVCLGGLAFAQEPATRNLNLVGDRFRPLKFEELTPAQKTMVDHLLSGERRGLGGPFNVLLRSPEMGDAAFNAAKDKFGEKGVVDMVATSGWYSLVSMALNVDRYPLPNGVTPGLKPLEHPLPPVGTAGFATTPVAGPKAGAVRASMAG